MSWVLIKLLSQSLFQSHFDSTTQIIANIDRLISIQCIVPASLRKPCTRLCFVYYPCLWPSLTILKIIHFIQGPIPASLTRIKHPVYIGHVQYIFSIDPSPIVLYKVIQGNLISASLIKEIYILFYSIVGLPIPRG